jgi:hypothetical protein
VTAAPRRSATDPSRGPSSILIALVAVVALVATGCGAGVLDPTGSATGAAGAAGASARPTDRPATASPSPDPGTIAITAFVALVTTPGFSYQATFKGQDRHSTAILPISNGLLQVSGADTLVRATFTFPPDHRFAVEHRLVNGKAWIKYATADSWRRIPARPSDTMAAFAAVRTLADVTDLGPAESGGRTYTRISFRSAIVNPVMIPATNLSDTALTTPKMTLLIDAAGRPVSGTAEIDAKGRVDGQLQEIVIELTVTFTKVGQAVTIKAP